MLRFLGLFALLAVGAHAQSMPASSARSAFEALKPMVGDWQMKTRRGAIAVNYRLVARGTVLVETFVTPSGKTSLTLYHLDKENLIATHYCPQGNQPRLRWVARPGGVHFTFHDATNLKKDASHLHAMTIQLDGDTLKKIETYETAGTPDVTTLVFTRTAAKP